MANNSVKISQLPDAANVASTDKLLILRSPSSNVSLRTANVSVFAANLQISNSIPANSTSNGLAGWIRYDSDNLYICVSNNVWKKASLNSW